MMTEKDRRRLVACLTLASHPETSAEEAAAAARAAGRLLEALGTTWEAALVLASSAGTGMAPPQPQTAPGQAADDGKADPISLARFVLDHPLFPVLSEKTQAFVRVIATGWTGSVSPAQREWLQNAADRVRRGGAPSERQQQRRQRRAA